MKSFPQFLKEQNDNASASKLAQVKALRNMLIGLLSSGVFDKDIERDFLMKEEISTFSAKNDEARYLRRLRALRAGVAALLTKDGEMDDALLKRHGITAMDKKKRGGVR